MSEWFIVLVFQTNYVGSIPTTRSKNISKCDAEWLGTSLTQKNM